MKLYKTIMLGLNAVYMLVIFAGCSRREPVVAQVGRSESITIQELKEDFSKRRSKAALQATDLPELKKHLERMVDQRIKVISAYEMGLDKDSTVLEKIRPVRTQRLINRLYETEIIDRVVKESDIREFYAQTGKEVVLRTIAFLCPAKTSPEEEEKIKENAMKVLQRVRSGEDFAELARKFSEDKSSAMNGGLIKPLTYTIKKDPVRRAAFSMRVGQASDLLKDDLSYQIIKVEEIRNKERKPYSQAREEIKRQLVTANRNVLSDRARIYWSDLMEKNHVQWHEGVLANLVEQMKSINNPTRNVILDSLETLSAEEKMRPLVHYQGGEITIGTFQEKLNTFPAHTRLPMDNPARLKTVIEQWLMGDMLSEKAVSKGLGNDKTLKLELKDVMEREMVQLVVQQYIYGEIQPSDEELTAYYEENKGKKYSESEKVKVQEIMVRDEELAKKIAVWVKAGRNFDELAEEYTERSGYKKKAGILNYFGRGRWGAVGEEAFNLRKGEIAGPVTLKNNRGYSIIKLLDKLPAKVKSYEEVQNRVLSDLRNTLRRTKEAAWISEKRKEYGVQTYEKVLEDAVRESS